MFRGHQINIIKYMKTLKLLLFSLFVIASNNLFAQNYRQGSCGTNSYSRLYITPYISLGGGSYSYLLNNTVMGTDSVFYNNEKGGVFTPSLGVNILYNIGKANLGGGAEFQGIYGTTNNGLYDTKQSAYLLKFYGRLEYRIYHDAFNDFGLGFEGGLLFPKNVVGSYPSMGAYGKVGIFYNYIINSTSSLYLGLDYSYSSFTTEIGSGISNHTLGDIKLTIGYRFWFK